MKPINPASAPPEVKAVFEDIKATRKVKSVNNFWRYLANEPRMLKHTWESLKAIMGDGALDPLTKELVYVAVSITNNCEYCMASHTAAARAKGATDEQINELYAVVALANMTNRLANAYKVPVDPAFKT
jgi:AhpD family alkylhydroperoxidase